MRGAWENRADDVHAACEIRLGDRQAQAARGADDERVTTGACDVGWSCRVNHGATTAVVALRVVQDRGRRWQSECARSIRAKAGRLCLESSIAYA